MPDFPPIAHVALSVTDLEASTTWYNQLVDAEPAMSLDDATFKRRVYLLPGGQLLGITAHDATAAGATFSPTQPGLDHISFACTSRDEIGAWAAKLDDVGVSHSGIVDAPYGAVLSFKDPDGNALEFFAPAS